MKNYFNTKNLTTKFTEYIFIFLTATIFLLFAFSKSYSEENVFIVDNVEVEGKIDVNFTRTKYIDKAFLYSFEILMSKILLSSDFKKISDIEFNKIKSLINSFQILNETYRSNKYKATFKIFYSDIKVKKFLSNKNISFSQPKNISAVFYPVLFIDDNLQNFDENYFYKHWKVIKIKNELINFILPIEDLDDIYNIKKIKNNIEELNINDLIKKYNTENYFFVLMQNENKKLNIYLKTNFNNNAVSKNISYEINNINDEVKKEKILKDLKIYATDVWKGENLINLSIPLSIRIKFENTNLANLDKLKNALDDIGIIDDYFLEEFNINHAFFKIYYYGNPKKLATELLEFGYKLENNQGHWVINNE